MKILKKALAILSVMAIAATCAVANTGSVSAADTTPTNLALNATATADSQHAQYGSGIETIVDGDMTTRWQSAAKGSDADNMAWVQLEFAQATTFNTLTIHWERARASGAGTAAFISNDGVTWTEVDMYYDPMVTIEDTQHYQIDFTFNCVTAKYLKLQFTALEESGKENPSIWELEVYNVESGLSMAGAQMRNSAVEGYDLRFVANFSKNLFDNRLDAMTDLGVILVRADELAAAGKTTADIDFNLAADGLAVRKVSATYLRNADLETTGNYTYTVTITGIMDIDREYVCVGYYTIDGVTVYTDAITRSVRGCVA